MIRPAALLVLLLLVVGCDPKLAPTAAVPPLVLTHAVASGDQGPLTLRGVVAARSRMRLGFKQPGVVAAVLVRQGDAVRPGQVLARLDDADARAQLQAALAQRDKARRDAERAARLAAEGAVPSSLKDDAQNQLQTAEAQVSLAQEALNRTRLVATAAGTVFQRLSEPGETLGAGTPVLLVDETAQLVLKVGITDRDLRRVKEGQKVTVGPEDGQAAFEGRVATVGASPAPEDGLYAVEIQPASARKLTAGVLMQVRFEGPQEQAVRIPLESLVHRQDRDHVFVVVGDGTSAKVRLQPVDVARSEGKTLLLRTGLRGGERIVAEGAYFLQDGQAVRVADPAQSRAAGSFVDRS